MSPSATDAPDRWVRGDGVELAVHLDGPDDAPAFVVAHGVGSSAAFVREAFAGAVVAAGWRLVAYDLRGHGASTPVRDPAGHALDRHLADLDAVVAATRAEVVGGVSLGGHVTVSWAADRGPAARAVVACLPAWTGRAVPGEGPHAAVAAEVAAGGTAEMLARIAADPAMVPWLREVLVRDWRRHDPDSLAAALTALDGALAPTEQELRRLPAPLGVVAWPDDPGHPVTTARAWAGWAPRAAYEEIRLADLAPSRGPLGQAALRALARLDVVPVAPDRPVSPLPCPAPRRGPRGGPGRGR